MKGWGDGGWLPTVDIADWEEQVDWALANYGHLIDAVEFPSEPDLPKHHFGYMDGTPERVYEMLKVVYEKVKAYNPNIPVICGAIGTMRNTQTVPGDYYGGYLLQKLVDLGANDYCDGYSFHIYKWFLTGYNDLHSAIDCYNRGKDIIGNKPFWQTEMGINNEADIPLLEKWLLELYDAGCPFINYYSLYGTSYSLVASDLSESPWYPVYKNFVDLTTPVPPVLTIPMATLGAGIGAGVGYAVGRGIGAAIGTVIGATLGYIASGYIPPTPETVCVRCGRSFPFTTHETLIWCPHCGEAQTVRRRG